MASLEIIFDTPACHFDGLSGIPNLSKNPPNTGFLYNIGFDLPKEGIKESNSDKVGKFWELDTKLHMSNVCKSDSMIRFLNRQPIYLELNKFNLYDELNIEVKTQKNV